MMNFGGRSSKALFLVLVQLSLLASALFQDEMSWLRGSGNDAAQEGQVKASSSLLSRLLQGSFGFPGAPQSIPNRGNTGGFTNAPIAVPNPLTPEHVTPAPQPPGTPRPPTDPPTDPPTRSPQTNRLDKDDFTNSLTPMLQRVVELFGQGKQQLEPLFGANSTYQVQHFLNALAWSYSWETSASTKKTMGRVDGLPGSRRRNLLRDGRVMNLGGEDNDGMNGDFKMALTHMGVLLGTAWHYGFHTGTCDELNHNATDEKHPSCGQDGLNYRYPWDGFAEEGFGCFHNDQEWLAGTATGCPVQPNVELIESDAKEEHRKLRCGLSVDIGCRDCCWWGRGMLRMTHQCDYGDYQAHWGNNGIPETLLKYIENPVEGRPSVNLCGNPGQVCSEDYPELKFLTGLYLWVRDVIHAEDPNFNFLGELRAFVDSKMDMRVNGNFVDRVGSLLYSGDASLLPPDYREHRHTVEAALDTIMSLAPYESPHYGNVAMCKKAVQSSIMEDQVAANAVDGIIDSPNISHTQCEESPWWQVDLETPHEIYAIAIVNRHDCCHERLDHVMIELFDEDGNLIKKNHTVQHDPNMEGHIVNVWTVDYEVPPVASLVKVSVRSPPDTCDYLNMAEVQIFGYCRFGDACLTGRQCHWENVAQCKPTQQSSTANDNVASLAVDGSAAGTYEELKASEVTVARTECQNTDPVWEVDLRSRHNISMVAVFIPGVDTSGMNDLIVEIIDEETGTTSSVMQHTFDRSGNIDNVAIFDIWKEEELQQGTTMRSLGQRPHLATMVRLRLPGTSPDVCRTLELAEVQVYSDCWDNAHCLTWPSCSYENIAQCKAATQSSTEDGGVAWKAIDGHQALSHTKCEQEPYWEVDLLDVYEVSEVILYNRNDCCYDRLNSVVIELKDEADQTVRSIQHEPEKDGVIEDSWSVKFENAFARKVRVMVQHNPGECGFLNLQNILVMRTCLPGEDCYSWSGCEGRGGNVAQCKPTTQSSVYYGDVSAQAVDGRESLAHTDCEVNPTWGVDLLEPRDVNHVVIHNREDCCFERLNGILVQLYNEQQELIGEQQHNLEKEGLIHTMWVASFVPPVANVRRVFLSTLQPDGFCEFLNLAEVEVMSTCLEGDACMTGFGCDEGNVAKCKPARQSTTISTRLNNTIFADPAGRAVDGHDSISHTECEREPWWEVNLLSMRDISEVVLHNRQDCCLERLNGVKIELMNDAGDVVATAQHNPATEGVIQFSWMAKFDNVRASLVKVSTQYESAEETCDFLNLAEVEVISTCIEGDACLHLDTCVHGNVALGKPARQMSTFEGAVAFNAVDGRESLSHTDCEENPWWEVDLLGEYHVDEVIVFNRLDCCQDRLNGIIVELLDTNGTSIARIQHDPSSQGPFQDKWSANFNREYWSMVASKVRISKIHAPGTCDFLNLADVHVMGACRETDACFSGIAAYPYGDVARCKKAKQSTVKNGAVATKATDGEALLAMTKCEEDPWWLVDLETRRDVKEVVVFNRRDVQMEYLNGVRVELLDSFGNTLIDAQHKPEEEGTIESLWSAKFEQENVRYVRVSTHHTNGTCAPLELAEVHVMSVCGEFDACKTGWDCENEDLALVDRGFEIQI